MTAKSFVGRFVVGTLAGVILFLASVASAEVGSLYYKEVEKDGRIYVFNTPERLKSFEASGDMGTAITLVGRGPKGETLVAENETALDLFLFKHNLEAYDRPTPKPSPSPAPAQGGAGSHFVVTFANDKKVVFGGYVQINAEFGDVDAYRGAFPPANGVNNRLRLRRARIGGWGDLNEYFDFKVMGDLAQADGLNAGNGGTRTALSGTDIFINYHQLPELNVKLGQFDTPYGMEQFMIPDMFTLTPERSAVTEALRPERQIGVMLWGKPLARAVPKRKDVLAYWLGVFNGNNRNITVNDNQKFMYMGRLEAQAFQGKVGAQPTTWKIGVDGYSSIDQLGTVLTQVGNAWVQTDGSLKALTVQGAHARRRAWGVDQRFECGRFTFFAEYLETRYQDALTAVPDFTARGYWGLLAYQVMPKKLEVVAKYERFTPNQALGDDLDTATAGLNYYVRGRDTRDLVLMLDYLHTRSHFRELNPSLGPDRFNEVMARVEFNF